MASYHKIPNLYADMKRADGSILSLCKEVFYMEKIEGESSFVEVEMLSDKTLKWTFFPGGQKQATFEALFNKEDLEAKVRAKFAESDHLQNIKVYGEVHGGKILQMNENYGPGMAFVAFEVQINGTFLAVPTAEKVARELGFDFVFYERGPATTEEADRQRDRPSTQALKRGMGPDKWSEGVIIRSIVELTRSDGTRLIAKHKNERKRETKTERTLDPNAATLFVEAEAVAEEFVVQERLTHVLSKLRAEGRVRDTLVAADIPEVVKGMLHDVKTECSAEIASWTKSVERAIGKKTASLVKERINEGLHEPTKTPA